MEGTTRCQLYQYIVSHRQCVEFGVQHHDPLQLVAAVGSVEQ